MSGKEVFLGSVTFPSGECNGISIFVPVRAGFAKRREAVEIGAVLSFPKLSVFQFRHNFGGSAVLIEKRFHAAHCRRDVCEESFIRRAKII